MKRSPMNSTGIRRAELAALQATDLDHARGTLTVRLGKRRKDRTVPIGDRAIHWIDRYVREARAELAASADEGFIFLSERGERLDPMALTIASLSLPSTKNLAQEVRRCRSMRPSRRGRGDGPKDPEGRLGASLENRLDRPLGKSGLMHDAEALVKLLRR